MAETTGGNLNSPKVPASALGARLSSWKEIARFLGADIRTCQRWERSQGLPVHRLGHSPRSRIIAYPAEIEEWRKSTLRVRGRQENGGSNNKGNGFRAAINGRSARRKFRPKILALLAIPVLAAAGAILLAPSFDRNPADFRIEGSSLIVLNKHGRRLWAFDTKLTKLRDNSFYRRRFPFKRYAYDEEGLMAEFPYIYFRDVDGDGRNEVLFALQTTDDIGVGDVLLFDHRGKTKWKFGTEKEIHVGDRRYPPDFVINILDLRDVNGDGRPEILVGSHCFEEAPEQFVILDTEKQILGEYWSYGQLSDYVITDNDLNGRPEIILVGTNNEYEQAFLAVFDPADMKGTSPQSPAFSFSGMPEGSARYYVRVAMTEIDRSKYPRGIFISVRATKNAHVVAETAKNFVWYDFDAEMNPPQITVTDTMRAAYREAFQQGLLPRPFDAAALKKELEAGVLYFDGANKAWVNRRAMAHPRSEKK